MKSGEKTVERCKILAALEGNHNGDLDCARRLVDAARQAGADGFVVRKRTVSLAAVRQVLDRPAARYRSLGPTYRKALERMELTQDSFTALCSRPEGLQALVAPYDVEAFRLAEQVPCAGWKIDSPCATHLPLVELLGRSGKPVMASSAGCTKREVQELVSLLAKEATLIHELNGGDSAVGIQDVAHLAALRDFGLPVGYRDNGADPSPALVAVALGAVVIEKPLTLDRNGAGPHHAMSLIPQEFAELVRKVRELEAAICSKGLRDPNPVEMDLLDWNRVSIVAGCPIPSGTTITREMLMLKPPFRALSPHFLPFLEGRRALYDISEDEFVTLGMVE